MDFGLFTGLKKKTRSQQIKDAAYKLADYLGNNFTKREQNLILKLSIHKQNFDLKAKEVAAEEDLKRIQNELSELNKLEI